MYGRQEDYLLLTVVLSTVQIAKRKDNAMNMHSLVRTNEKGQPFKGQCIKCGMKNLTLADMKNPCIGKMSNDDALIKVITS